jgi:hypothetical protein
MKTMEELRKAYRAVLLFASALLVPESFTFRLLRILGILDLTPYLHYWSGLGALILFFALLSVNGFAAIQIVKKLGFRFDVPTLHREKRVP